MRTIVAMCVMAALSAGSVRAADIQGKWGLGAGVFAGGAQVSLIRGKSERSAWLFDVAIFQQRISEDQQSSPSPEPFLQRVESWTVQAGPGYRRFLRPDARFSPYWDVEVSAIYARSHFTASQAPFAASFTQTEAGAAGQLAFGLEYFFRPHLSVAAHGTVASVDWRHTSVSYSLSPFGDDISTTGHVMTSSIGFAPVIFVRGYW